MNEARTKSEQREHCLKSRTYKVLSWCVWWTWFERSKRGGLGGRRERGGQGGRSRNHARAIVDEADEVGIVWTPPIPHQPILQSRSPVLPYIEPNTNDQKKSQI